MTLVIGISQHQVGQNFAFFVLDRHEQHFFNIILGNKLGLFSEVILLLSKLFKIIDLQIVLGLQLAGKWIEETDADVFQAAIKGLGSRGGPFIVDREAAWPEL